MLALPTICLAQPGGAVEFRTTSEKGIILWTLRYGDEVREEEAYFGGIKEAKPDPKLMTLVKKLIEERSKPWDPAMVDDPVQASLLELIAIDGVFQEIREVRE